MEMKVRKLWNTQNDLAEKVRAQAVILLNQQLADALDLHLQAKQAHWNLVGRQFHDVHLHLDGPRLPAVRERRDRGQIAHQLDGVGGLSRPDSNPPNRKTADTGRGFVIVKKQPHA